MKISITNNTIRFRLKQPQVEHFSQHKSITEILSLGPGVGEQLRFTLSTVTGSKLLLTYSEHAITVILPYSLAQDWTMTDLVGIEEEIEVSSGKKVKVIIEKDFACLHKASQENEGAYPNPKDNY